VFYTKFKSDSVDWVRERTIPTEIQIIRVKM
jgi:hypothetical protein